jgi:putative PIN family toxin of toxin-antitoxin system
MRVVLDTCILFQALYSNAGASHQVLKLLRNGEIELVLSVPVYEEYRDVLLRKESLKQFELSREDVTKILDFLALAGVRIEVHFLMRPNLRDENDNMFVDLAFASGSRYIITKNIRDFVVDRELDVGSFEVITPSDFMKRWREHHG